eukprot:365151-Chlamydomonas_euryale.AAC.16
MKGERGEETKKEEKRQAANILTWPSGWWVCWRNACKSIANRHPTDVTCTAGLTRPTPPRDQRVPTTLRPAATRLQNRPGGVFLTIPTPRTRSGSPCDCPSCGLASRLPTHLGMCRSRKPRLPTPGAGRSRRRPRRAHGRRGGPCCKHRGHHGSAADPLGENREPKQTQARAAPTTHRANHTRRFEEAIRLLRAAALPGQGERRAVAACQPAGQPASGAVLAAAAAGEAEAAAAWTRGNAAAATMALQMTFVALTRVGSSEEEERYGGGWVSRHSASGGGAQGRESMQYCAVEAAQGIAPADAVPRHRLA